MGTIGATFYLIGVGLIYVMTGTLNLADMALRIPEVADQKPILVAAGFITIGLALKAAVFPLHVWLPNAYTYAPNVVTVFLGACATKVALYLLLRFDFFVFQPNLLNHDIQFAYFLMPLAVLAILIASAVALFEKNIKRLFAYSSVAQIGYILLGASLVSVAGLTASMVHMFNHGLAKGTVFLAIACLATRYTHLRLENIAGAAKHMPWTMAAFVVAGFSLVGIPGTAGFISKWYLLSAALEQGTVGWVLVVIIIISSLMAMAYVWRVIEAAYFGFPTNGANGQNMSSKQSTGTSQLKEAPIVLLTVTWLAALANLYFGLAPSLPITLASNAAETLLRLAP
jgi:multicomponent Na+:H+ antiporter subunit D